MFSRKQSFVAYTVALLLVGGIFVYQLWSGYDQRIQNARSTVENLAGLLQQRLTSTLRRTDAILAELALSVRDEAILESDRSRSAPEINSALAARRMKFPEISAFRILNARGNLLYTSDPVSHFSSLADRPYFKELRDNPEAVLVYSDVQISRFTGQTVIVMGRALRSSSGEFMGAAIAVLDLATYGQLFESLDLGPKGMIVIRRTDSRMILRQPANPALVNKPIAHPIQKLIEAGQHTGYLRYVAVTDGVERLFAFTRVPDYPFYFIVGLAADDVLAGWRREAITTGSVGLLALLIFSSLLLSLSRAYARESEHARHLAEREQNLRFVLDATGDGIWDWDNRRRQVTVNTRFCEILGLPGKGGELTGAELRAHGFSEDEPVFRNSFRKCLKGEASLWLENRLQRKDGDIIWVLVRGDVVQRDESGRALRMLGSITDVTGNKLASERLARSEMELQTIIDTEPDSVELLASDGTIQKLNHAGLVMSDADTIDQILGRRRQSLVAPEYQDAFVALIADVFNGKSEKLEFEAIGLKGTRRWLAIHAGPLRSHDGKITALLGVTRDVTTRKIVEAELRDAVQAAETANRAKSAFLAAMSHEIRTPMNGILGMAQMLMMENLPEANRQDHARTILTSGRTLLNLLNDILDLSKIEAGKLELETTAFEPGQLIHEVQSLFAVSAREKRLLLESGGFGLPGQRYRGDAHRLRQMLANLVGNAIKFTLLGSVHIEGSEIERDVESAVLEFSVSDTGIGIPAEKVDLLFQPFSQMDNSISREFGGTGLGLSIVRQIAGQMGGDVGVHSEPGKGSRFWFRVRARIVPIGEDTRRAERPAHESFKSTAPPTGLRGHVLVVEDEPVNRKLITAMLSRLGLEVTMAYDGQQGIDATTRSKRPDLVLMDLRMPVLDGYAATGRIRQWEAANDQSRLPIIALTAHAFANDRELCIAAGMDDFLTKPITFGPLISALGKWLPPAAEPPLVTPLSSRMVNSVDGQAMMALADEIQAMLSQNKYDAIIRFRDLQAALTGTGVVAEIEEISALLDELRFDLASERLRHLAVTQGWCLGIAAPEAPKR